MNEPLCQWCTLPIRPHELSYKALGRHYHEDLATCVGRLREERTYWRNIAVALNPEKEEA